MALSQISKLRVILFTLTISGALCEVMRGPIDVEEFINFIDSKLYSGGIQKSFESIKDVPTMNDKLGKLKNSIPSELKQKVGTDIDRGLLEAAAINIKNAADALPAERLMIKTYANILLKNINAKISDTVLEGKIQIDKDLSDSVELILSNIDSIIDDNTGLENYHLEEIKSYIVQLIERINYIVSKDINIEKLNSTMTELNTHLDLAISIVKGPSSIPGDVIAAISTIGTDLKKIEEEKLELLPSNTPVSA